jgi:hypothetical protein
MSMLGSNCCCVKPCGTATNSGGAGITINAYTMPEYGGMVEFFYEAFSVRDRFTVYNTQNENDVYFDTGERVSGSRTIKFYKPEGVTSVTVRVEGPQGTAWNYRIGCPQVSCLQQNCQDDPNEQIESITLTLDIPSYSLKIPRIGMEYWYQHIDFRYGFPNEQGVRKKIPQKIPKVLPLDCRFIRPYELPNPYYDPDYVGPSDLFGSPFQYSVSRFNYEGINSESRPVGPDDYVRPDELPEDPEQGWFFGGSVGVRVEMTYAYYGRWEYVGKVEFSAEYSIDGNYYSGTYELQKVPGTHDEYIYYFDDDSPSCNALGSNGYYQKSFIAVKGCDLYISNIKAKYKYGFDNGDPQCGINTDIENFSFSGYTPVTQVIPDYFNNRVPIYSFLHFIGFGWSHLSDVIDSNSSYPGSRISLRGSEQCYEDKRGLSALPIGACLDDSETRKIYSPSQSGPAFIIKDENSLSPLRPKYGWIRANLGTTTDENFLTSLGGTLYLGGVTSDIYRNISFTNEMENLFFDTTGKGLYKFVDPDFFKNARVLVPNAYYYLTILGYDPSDPALYYPPDSFPYSDQRTGVSLPWFPTYIPYGGFYDNNLRWNSLYDPYYVEGGLSWWSGVGAGGSRCIINPFIPFPIDPCAKCDEYWYKDNGMLIEEIDFDRGTEIFIRDITVNR